MREYVVENEFVKAVRKAGGVVYDPTKITLTEVHGKREHVVFTELVSAFDKIAPVRDEFKADYEGADTVIEFRGTAKSPDSYFLSMTKDGKKTVIFIEATNKAMKVMKFYNSKALVPCRCG